MVNAFHGRQTIEQGIHGIISFEYANEAARLAAGPFQDFDINKLAYELDTDRVYILTDPTGPTWELFITVGFGTGALSGPVSSTDNAIVRWNGTDGYTIQDSSVLIDDLGHITGVTSLNFDFGGSAPSHSEGRIFYDGYEHTLAVYNDEADITHQLGQESFIRIYNNTGSTIVNGAVVYSAGTEVTEYRPSIDLAIADSLSTSTILGVATHDIETGTFGYITAFGLVNNVDTSAFSPGDVVYLSDTVAGGLSTAPPSGSGSFTVRVGVVIRSDVSLGKILVNTASDSRAAGDASDLILTVEKASAGTINAGSVVRLVGYDVGSNFPTVELADASSTATMPAIGIARDSVTNTSEGQIVVSGTFINIDTSSFSAGDELYVSETAGELTNVRPQGTALVQKIAQVLRSHPSLGIIEIFGSGRTNALPNLAQDNIWIGDVNGLPQETPHVGEGGSVHALADNLEAGFLSSDGYIKLESFGDEGDYLLVDGTRPMEGNLNMDGYNILNVEQVDFAPVDPNTVVYQEGKVFYDSDDRTISIMTDQSDVVLQTGHEQHLRVVNNTGITVTNGQAVRINGVQGNRPTIGLATTTSDAGSHAVGVATHDILNGQEGIVTTYGNVRSFDTSSFSPGDILFVDPASAGGLTNIKPTGENFVWEVGVALNSTNNGSILVAPRGPSNIEDLHDVGNDGVVDGYYLRADGYFWNGSFFDEDARSAVAADPSGIDHGLLAGLGDDDHTQYILTDGTRAFTGNIDVGGNSIVNVSLVDGVDVSAHASRHENGGADEISVTGLSGLLADPQTPLTHASTHISGGSDEVDGDQIDIDWNPSNYTPTIAPTEVTSLDHLTAHLAGIDTVLSTIVTDHGGLTGLGDDDHTQYILVDGTRAFTGNIDVGGNSITNVNLVDGVDVSAHAARHESGGADAIDGYNVDLVYTPVNYTDPVNDIIGEHIAAIDEALATAGGGGGDVTGPGSSTDNAIARFDGSTGKIIQNSSVLLTDAGDITFESTVVTPILSQADDATASVTGDALTVQAQNATGTTSTGGDLVLTSGTGTSTDGDVEIQVGGAVAITLDENTATTLTSAEDGYVVTYDAANDAVEYRPIKKSVAVEFALTEDANNFSPYFYTWRSTGADTETGKRSTTSTGMSATNSCNPYVVPFNATVTKAILVVRGVGVQNGSVTYPVSYQTDLLSVGFTGNTKIADVDFSISNSFTVGTFSVGNTNFRGSTSLSVDVDEGDTLGLQFINGTGASLAGQSRMAFITFVLEER